MNVERDISAVVWVGCLLLLFLAVAVHEGWFTSHAPPLITSGTVNNQFPNGATSGTVDDGGRTWMDSLNDAFLWPEFFP